MYLNFRESWILEDDVAGTDLGGFTIVVDPLSTNPKHVLSKIDF